MKFNRALAITILVFMGLLIVCAPGFSWTHGRVTGAALNCSTYDTTGFGANLDQGMVVLSNCYLPASGHNRSVFVTASAQVTCGANSDAAFQIYAYDGPTFQGGASFNGSISGSTLTVNSITAPPPFLVQTGQILYDTSSGANIPFNLSITGQLSGTTGGVGTYSLSGSASVSNEAMWALVQLPGANRILMSKIQEDTACRNYVTLDTFGGAYQGGAAQHLYIFVLMIAESIGGKDPQSASWKNGQITVLTKE